MDLMVSVQSEGIDAIFEDLSRLTGKPAGRMIRERAPALGRYFATATQPVADLEASEMSSKVASSGGRSTVIGEGISESTLNFTGDSKYAKALGIAAVKRDIARVYISPALAYREIQNEDGQKAAKAFYAMIKSGDLAGARKLLRKLSVEGSTGPDVMNFDDGALHQRMRNARGKISAKKSGTVVTAAAALKEYVKQIVRRVGWAKSGWITAARQIPNATGLSGLPGWMKLPAPGRGVDRTQGDDPSITLYNDVQYLDDLIPPRYISGAEMAFEASLVKELEHVIEHYKAKHGA